LKRKREKMNCAKGINALCDKRVKQTRTDLQTKKNRPRKLAMSDL